MDTSSKKIYKNHNFTKKYPLVSVKIVFHAVYFGLYSLVCLYFVLLIWYISENATNEETVKTPKLSSWMHSNIWNLVFQTVFLLLALAYDVLEWVGKQESTLSGKIRYWRDVIFCGLVFPYTCFVFGMFWTIYAIDRELVFPRVYDDVIPWWFNQCVHTNILVMVVVETLLQARRHPTNAKLELIFNATCGILYAIVYYSIYFFAHCWLYNVFGLMNWWQVCLFQCSIWLSTYIFYLLQFPINRLIHGSEPAHKKTLPQVEEKNGGDNGIEVKKNEVEEKKNAEEVKKNEVEVKKNGVEVKNVVEDKMNGVGEVDKSVLTKNVNTDFKAPPFSTKSWSLKYRTIRSQFENSSL